MGPAWRSHGRTLIWLTFPRERFPLFTHKCDCSAIPGKYAAAYALERFGRKFTLIWFAAIAAISAVIFGLVRDPLLPLAFGVIMSFFGVGVDPAIKIYGAEQYPTRMRETGVGFFEGVGRFFGGALVPFIMSFILANRGVTRGVRQACSRDPNLPDSASQDRIRQRLSLNKLMGRDRDFIHFPLHTSLNNHVVLLLAYNDRRISWRNHPPAG